MLVVYKRKWSKFFVKERNHGGHDVKLKRATRHCGARPLVPRVANKGQAEFLGKLSQIR